MKVPGTLHVPVTKWEFQRLNFCPKMVPAGGIGQSEIRKTVRVEL